MREEPGESEGARDVGWVPREKRDRARASRCLRGRGRGSRAPAGSPPSLCPLLARAVGPWKQSSGRSIITRESATVEAPTQLSNLSRSPSAWRPLYGFRARPAGGSQRTSQARSGTLRPGRPRSAACACPRCWPPCSLSRGNPHARSTVLGSHQRTEAPLSPGSPLATSLLSSTLASTPSCSPRMPSVVRTSKRVLSLGRPFSPEAQRQLDNLGDAGVGASSPLAWPGSSRPLGGHRRRSRLPSLAADGPFLASLLLSLPQIS